MSIGVVKLRDVDGGFNQLNAAVPPKIDINAVGQIEGSITFELVERGRTRGEPDDVIFAG
jgi:hypothetical protein